MLFRQHPISVVRNNSRQSTIWCQINIISRNMIMWTRSTDSKPRFPSPEHWSLFFSFATAALQQFNMAFWITFFRSRSRPTQPQSQLFLSSPLFVSLLHLFFFDSKSAESKRVFKNVELDGDGKNFRAEWNNKRRWSAWDKRSTPKPICVW